MNREALLQTTSYKRRKYYNNFMESPETLPTILEQKSDSEQKFPPKVGQMLTTIGTKL